jgi:hypothetical protein
MYIATYVIDIAALLFLIGLLYSSAALNKNRKKPFLIGIVLTLIIILSEAVTIYAASEAFNNRSLHILCNVLGFAFTPIVPVAITLIFDRKIFSKWRIVLLPTLVNVVFALLSPFYDGYFM